MPTLAIGLAKPGGPSQVRLAILGASNYHRLFSTLKAQGEKKRWRYVAAFTSRLGAPYKAGRWLSFPIPNNRAYGRDSTWPIAPFRKINAYLALAYELAKTHWIQLQYLGDFFWDVDYPALLMDTKASRFHLLSSAYTWAERLQLRVYYNQIQHFMTDERRSESQIQSRPIMPGMYMPMLGKTQSLGSTTEFTWLSTETFQLKQQAEASWHQALADMTMRPLDPRLAPMFLRNLADIRFWQMTQSWHAHYDNTYSRFHFYVTGSIFRYRVADTLSYAPLQAYQEAYGGGSHAQRQLEAYQIGLDWEGLLFSNLLPEWQLSYGTRAPTHTELYAYYLYVPMDNSIQMGNSTLRPERLLRTEVRLRYGQKAFSAQVQGFFNWIGDYIAPRTFIWPYSNGNQTTQSWRILQNTGTAWTTGLNAQLQWNQGLWESVLLSGYTYGWHQTLREPLPWIYPWYVRLQITYAPPRHRFSLEGFWANTQTHLSRQIYPEDTSPAYLLMHLRYQYSLFAKASQALWIQLAIENLLNTFGWDHLSVGNMPFLGRTLIIGLLYTHHGKSR